MGNTVSTRILQRTALTAALLAAYGYAPGAAAVNVTIEGPSDLTGSNLSNSTVTVNNGGVVTGSGAQISGSAYDVVLVNSGGSLSLENSTISENLDGPSLKNGRAIRAEGAGAHASLTNSTIEISAQTTGTDYTHAFTVGVGAVDGGHIDLNGGSVTASGSKRTLGMQANDGGSISATAVQITTNGTFGHAVEAYRTPTLADSVTQIDLDHVSITTNGATYAVGIQSGNKGARVTATDTDITTKGAGSFGIETFNDASVDYSGGSITTLGTDAAGVRVYGGDQGAGSVNIDNTWILTSGEHAAGVVAGDMTEPTSGTATLNGATVDTTGGGAAGLESALGSSIMSTQSKVHTQGDASHGVYAHDGGTVTLNGDSVTTDGSHSYGLYATGTGSKINAAGASVATNGLYGFGVRAEAGGAIVLDGGSVATNNAKGRNAQDGDGSRAYALSADGAGSRISTRNGTSITTQGQRAYGAYATNGGHITLNGGSVATNGFMAYGLYASGASSVVDAGNVNVATSGNAGDGIWAYQGGTVNLTGGTVTIGGAPNVNTPHETSNGLLAAGGTGTSAAGIINASGVSVMTTGSGSAGVLAGATIGDANTSGVINLNHSSITVQGNNAVAANVSYGSTLTAGNSSLVSQKGDGIVLTDNATVNLTGTRVEAAGASLVSNLDSTGQTQNIVIGSGSTLTQNNGTLLQVNRTQAGMDGVVNLTLKANSVSRGDIVDLGGLNAGAATRSQGGRTNFTVDAGASWAGIVRGINDATAANGASFEDNGGAPISGNVAAGTNSVITFNNGATIGGGVSIGSGSVANFQGKTSIAGSVIGTGASFSFNGPTNIGQSVVGDGTSFEFSKSGATVIGGSVTLDNNASLKGGTTATPIMIAGDVTASNGAMLGGNLFVQGALNARGAIVSPGNSVGTQSYASIVNLASIYKADVNAAGNSDLIIVRSGDVDLSGTHLTVAQENGNSGYVLNHDYTILRAVDGNVTGEFSGTGLDDSFANTLVTLDPVQYAAKDVRISLSLNDARVDAIRAGLTSNQNHALDGVISVAGQNATASAALMSTHSADALDQLSGEIHASTQAALMQSGGLVQRAVSDRLRDSLGATQPAVYPLWAQVVGDRYTLSGDGNAAKTTNSTGGLFLGGDTAIGKGWRLGAAVGYTDGDIKVNDRSSKSDTKSYTAALYGGKSWAVGKGRMDFLAGGGYTRHDIDTHRSVTLGGRQTLKASYNADSYQLFTELGYAMPVGPSAQVGPYLGVAWLSQHADSFSESGGSAALRGDGQTDATTTTTLGLRGQTTFDIGRNQAILRAGLGWRHANGDVDPSRRVAFTDGNGASFDVAGAPIAKDAAVVNVGAEIAMGRSTTVGLSYNGQFGGNNTDNNGTLYLKVLF